MLEGKPFEEWGHLLIPSSYGKLNGKSRYYRVCYGLVTWRKSDPRAIHKACFPVVQFGRSSDYKMAVRNREIKLEYPCHILEEDMDLVIEAMNKLREEFMSINFYG